MYRTASFALTFSLAAALAVGCSADSSIDSYGPEGKDADEDVKLVAPPAAIVGKWRHEVTDGKSKRTVVHHFKKDGSVEVDVRVETPDRKARDLVKRAVIEVEEDRITMVDLSRTGPDGVEDVLPAERRRVRRYQTAMKRDELRLTEVDEAGEPIPDVKVVVMKRIKE